MFQPDQANQSHIDQFIKAHQDATLDKNDWVPDHKVNKCTRCKKDFTFFYRKHHCRICGHVFCANCTLVKNVLNNGKILIFNRHDFRGLTECEDV